MVAVSRRLAGRNWLAAPSIVREFNAIFAFRSNEKKKARDGRLRFITAICRGLSVLSECRRLRHAARCGSLFPPYRGIKRLHISAFIWHKAFRGIRSPTI